MELGASLMAVSEFNGPVPCTVCGEGRVVVWMLLVTGLEVAYCKGCWWEVWGYGRRGTDGDRAAR